MYRISLLVVLVAAVCTALPAVDQQVDEASQYEALPRADRVAGATCDLLSASVRGVTLNHAACAAHCLYIGRGNRGGRCIDGVCHCRK